MRSYPEREVVILMAFAASLGFAVAILLIGYEVIPVPHFPLVLH